MRRTTTPGVVATTAALALAAAGAHLLRPAPDRRGAHGEDPGSPARHAQRLTSTDPGRTATIRLTGAQRRAMAQWLPRHSVPLTVDFSDGYTFSGVQRSSKSGAIEQPTVETPFGFGPITGDPGQALLSHVRGTSTFTDPSTCEPGAVVTAISETVTDLFTFHFRATLPDTPTRVTAANVLLSQVDVNPGGTNLDDADLADLAVRIRVRSPLGEEVTGTLVRQPSEQVPPGAVENYLVTFHPPLAFAGEVFVDVTFEGITGPTTPSAPRTRTDTNCPGRTLVERFEQTQLLLAGLTTVLFLDDDTEPQPPPTHVVKLEVERMFRQGLPLADPVRAGDPVLVVRPTTARELDESLGTMTVGGTVLPFDARASLLGELANCERTILGISPADLGQLRQEILDAVEASGRDPTDPAQIARHLRRNPGAGRVTVTLDAGVDLDLDTAHAAYLGLLDAGYLGLRPDILLRETTEPLTVGSGKAVRDVRIAVEFLESPDVTNVLPFADKVRKGDLRRMNRLPVAGGLFQNRDTANTAQCLPVSDGPRSRKGDMEGVTDGNRQLVLYTAVAGEDTPRAAHALGHVVGHLLFGGGHDRGDPFSLLNDRPPLTPGDEQGFFEENVDAFTYGDLRGRAALRQLEKRWRAPAE